MTKSTAIKKILVTLLAVMTVTCFTVPSTSAVYAASNTEASSKVTTEGNTSQSQVSADDADDTDSADVQDGEQAENVEGSENAENANEEIEGGAEDEPEIVVPGKVTNLTATTSSGSEDMKISDNFFGKREITLTWDPVEEADNYIVTKSLGKDTVYETVEETSKPEINLTMEKSSICFFKVIAEKNGVQGEPSDWVSIIPGSAANSGKIEITTEAEKVDSTKTTTVKGTTENIVDNEIRYTTSDPTIATVDQEGTVTGVGGGEVKKRTDDQRQPERCIRP